jgi:quercetin dioxygenase-like cupin family protein
MTDLAEHTHETHLCPNCQQALPHTRIDVVDVAAAVEADKLTDDDVFKRTYIGHGKMSSVFVFQGNPGPFRRHVHTTHDEIGYVLAGSGSVTVGGVTRPVKPGDVWIIPANTPHSGEFGDAPQVLFISSPIDDPDNQDRVWLD